MFSFDMVLVHVLVQLYIFDMTHCESFLFSKNKSPILMQLALITFFTQKYIYIYIYLYIYILYFLYIYIHIYSDVMKTVQCTHPPHHDNGFVATCLLWTASGGVKHCQCQNQQSAQQAIGSFTSRPQRAFRHRAIVVMRTIGALDCRHDVTI